LTALPSGPDAARSGYTTRSLCSVSTLFAGFGANGSAPPHAAGERGGGDEQAGAARERARKRAAGRGADQRRADQRRGVEVEAAA
jgi:hypothetical protein